MMQVLCHKTIRTDNKYKAYASNIKKDMKVSACNNWKLEFFQAIKDIAAQFSRQLRPRKFCKDDRNLPIIDITSWKHFQHFHRKQQPIFNYN